MADLFRLVQVLFKVSQGVKAGGYFFTVGVTDHFGFRHGSLVLAYVGYVESFDEVDRYLDAVGPCKNRPPDNVAHLTD